MGSVDLDAVEADAPGVGCGLREVRDRIGDRGLAHGFAALLARQQQARGAHGRHVRVSGFLGLAQDAHVPELRKDPGALGVDGVHDAFPAREGRLAVQRRNRIGTRGGEIPQRRAFGDDQTGAAAGACGVVGGDVVTRGAPGAHLARHRRHDDPVRQGQLTELEGLEERGEGIGHGLIQSSGE